MEGRRADHTVSWPSRSGSCYPYWTLMPPCRLANRAMCLFVVALFVSGNHIAKVPSPAPHGGTFSVGVGVWLCLAASIIGALASLFVWRLLSAVGIAVATPPAT